MDAYHFVREGLSFAVSRVHGPESSAQITIWRFLAANELDLEDLRNLYETDQLDEDIKTAIYDAGGLDQLNRHVSGTELCWGLREYAQQQWGLMAKTVLARWNIHATDDFGQIVFAMIDCDLMQKQPGDSIEDFSAVFDFKEAFDKTYSITPKPTDNSD